MVSQCNEAGGGGAGQARRDRRDFLVLQWEVWVFEFCRVIVPTLLQNPAVSCPISVSVKHWHGPPELIQWKCQASINACSNTKPQLPSLPQEQAASAQPQPSDLGSVSKAKWQAGRRKGATNWKWGCGLLVRGMIRAQKGAGRKWRGAIQAQGTVRTVRSGPCCWWCAGEVSTPMWKCSRKTGNSWDTGCKTSLGINRFDWNESPKKTCLPVQIITMPKSQETDI